MLSRDQAIALITAHVVQPNIIKHMHALEAAMGGLYDTLSARHTLQDLGGSKEEWMMAGLLHDGDYCETVSPNRQGIQIIEWAREAGLEIPENVAHAIAAHNWSHTEIAPANLMDWSIFAADSLTGLVVASALVLPTKKLADLKVESVLKHYREPGFAKGTRRDDIATCETQLGLPLEQFVMVVFMSMQAIASDLGL